MLTIEYQQVKVILINFSLISYMKPLKKVRVVLLVSPTSDPEKSSDGYKITYLPLANNVCLH